MTEYTNCVLQGYGVLPGPPTRLHVTNIATDYAIVHWAPPRTLRDTVLHYNVHYRRFISEDTEYTLIEKVLYSSFLFNELNR